MDEGVADDFVADDFVQKGICLAEGFSIDTRFLETLGEEGVVEVGWYWSGDGGCQGAKAKARITEEGANLLVFRPIPSLTSPVAIRNLAFRTEFQLVGGFPT